MICPACSAAITANRFCTLCGEPLDALGAASSLNDLFEGRSLRSYCDEAPLPWKQVCALVHAICIAVERAGEHLADPDLSPENIYVESGAVSRIKLVEASIAMWRGAEDREPEDRDTAMRRVVDKYGLMLPNVDYYSPERLMGKPRGQADRVYVLGVVAYELLVGRRPFVARSPAELITAQLKKRPQLPPELDVPDAVTAVVMRCLEKLPSDRYADVIELADALAQL